MVGIAAETSVRFRVLNYNALNDALSYVNISGFCAEPPENCNHDGIPPLDDINAEFVCGGSAFREPEPFPYIMEFDGADVNPVPPCGTVTGICKLKTSEVTLKPVPAVYIRCELNSTNIISSVPITITLPSPPVWIHCVPDHVMPYITSVISP